MKTYLVHISIYPLGSNEAQRALTAIGAVWIKPTWIRCQNYHGAVLLEASVEASLPINYTERLLTERLSIAVWQQLGRYAKVVIEISSDSTCEQRSHELAEPDYLKLMRIH